MEKPLDVDVVGANREMRNNETDLNYLYFPI